MDNNVKEAFNKVKEDVDFLNNEILNMKTAISNLTSILTNLTKNSKTLDSTFRQIISTNFDNSTDSSTVPLEIEGLKPLNLPISIGNKGVSTDRQTDNSTDNSTYILEKNKENITKNIEFEIKEAKEILESLDSIKKDIRLKFKHLTPREMLVFSYIYQSEEQGNQDNQDITYKSLSKQLKLSESSIRDYVQGIIFKGIPIKKEKMGNKQVSLSISPDLKKIATLHTIMQLREL